MTNPKPHFPILCLDFDGVLHSYTSGWQGPSTILDPPVDGAMKFLWEAIDHFNVCIYSSRSAYPEGIKAMKAWIGSHLRSASGADSSVYYEKLARIAFPVSKPSALVTLDDRALTFTGTWPSMEALRNFKPWTQP